MFPQEKSALKDKFFEDKFNRDLSDVKEDDDDEGDENYGAHADEEEDDDTGLCSGVSCESMSDCHDGSSSSSSGSGSGSGDGGRAGHPNLRDMEVEDLEDMCQGLVRPDCACIDLDLISVRATEKAAVALASALSKNTSIMKLKLPTIPINVGTLSHLAEAFKPNTLCS
ncbi:hypothetical protein Pelo_2081 [Pelomyxa schiedti]|nr:hypothetical protein Pelo_2081 [Pelomyxa schiedti]